MAQSEELFYLVPQNQKAVEVVEMKMNKPYVKLVEGRRSLSFSPARRSKTEGRLVSFGRHRNNDVLLPLGPSPETPQKQYQKYKSDHFFFYLAPSGELIIRDLSEGRTQIEVPDATADEQTLYNIHKIQDGLRQRVIPRMDKDIYLYFGIETVFLFGWTKTALDEAKAQDILVRQARLLAAPTGMGPTVPDDEEHGFTSPEHQLRSRYTPTVPSRTPIYKSCHKYDILGEGAFGVVRRAVDLQTGDLWALKEIKAEAKGEAWREAFKQEVEAIAGLQHEHIEHFETFQDFRIGGRFQLFFRLYEGSLADLLKVPEHHCIGPLPDVPAWTPLFVDQVLRALRYLHSESMIHRDIKPGNILYDHADGNLHPTFYLADFGLATKEAEALQSYQPGTLAYMAPEVTLSGNGSVPESDVWSFAITLGCVLGYWCEDERDTTTDNFWRNKLQALGSSEPYDDPEFPSLTMPEQRRWYCRLRTLVERGILPSMFSHMLAAVPHRASTADCLLAPVDEFVKRPQISPGRNNAEWHMKRLQVNGMSIDVLKGGHHLSRQ